MQLLMLGCVYFCRVAAGLGEQLAQRSALCINVHTVVATAFNMVAARACAAYLQYALVAIHRQVWVFAFCMCIALRSVEKC